MPISLCVAFFTTPDIVPRPLFAAAILEMTKHWDSEAVSKKHTLLLSTSACHVGLAASRFHIRILESSWEHSQMGGKDEEKLSPKAHLICLDAVCVHSAHIALAKASHTSLRKLFEEGCSFRVCGKPRANICWLIQSTAGLPSCETVAFYKAMEAWNNRWQNKGSWMRMIVFLKVLSMNMTSPTKQNPKSVTWHHNSSPKHWFILFCFRVSSYHGMHGFLLGI